MEKAKRTSGIKCAFLLKLSTFSLLLFTSPATCFLLSWSYHLFLHQFLSFFSSASVSFFFLSFFLLHCCLRLPSFGCRPHEATRVSCNSSTWSSGKDSNCIKGNRQLLCSTSGRFSGYFSDGSSTHFEARDVSFDIPCLISGLLAGNYPKSLILYYV